MKHQGKNVVVGNLGDKGLTEAQRKTEERLVKNMLKDERPMEFEETNLFNRLTVEHLVPREANNSHMNHRWVFDDMNQAEMQKLKHVFPRIGNQIRKYVGWKFGKRNGFGTDLEKYMETQDHPGAEKGPCIVIGSGPSLDLHIQQMAEEWEGGIICSSSQYSTLYYHGRAANYCLSYDYRDSPGKMHVPHEHRAHKKTRKVVMPTLMPDLLQHWKGERVYFRTFDPYVQFYETVLPVAYRWIDATIAPFGCSMAAEIALARALGYGPIFLYGCDLSYPGGYTYFTRQLWQEDKKVWKEIKNIPTHKEMAGGVHRYYAEAITALGWLDGIDIIDCSRGVLNDVFPTCDGEQVIHQQGKGPGIDYLMATKQEIRDRLGPVLAGQGSFWVEIHEEDGSVDHKMVRADPNNWAIEMRMYMEAIRQKGANIDIDANLKQITGWVDTFKKTGGKWK